MNKYAIAFDNNGDDLSIFFVKANDKREALIKIFGENHNRFKNIPESYETIKEYFRNDYCNIIINEIPDPIP